MPIRAIFDGPEEGRRTDSDDPPVVVAKAYYGNRVKSGGWTDPTVGEDYKPLIEAWRRQDPNAPQAPPATAAKA